MNCFGLLNSIDKNMIRNIDVKVIMIVLVLMFLVMFLLMLFDNLGWFVVMVILML